MLVRIRSRYEDAITNGAVRQEAHLRLGYVELLRGRTVEALMHFDQVGAPDDRTLRYMLHLLRGKALTAAQRHDDAIESFRRAFDEVPYAQSATLALGAALVTRGRHNEAEDLISRMLTLPAPPFDPWTIHTMPEWRFWEPLMSSLRKGGS
jgi:tetratricopeptide (TPR) repeat protein